MLKKQEPFPGAEHRLYKDWFFGKADPAKRAEVVIAGEPVVLCAYRLAFDVARVSGRHFPKVALQQSTRHYLRGGWQKVDTKAQDLYADTFGEPELWTIIPVIALTPLVDPLGREREPIVRKRFNFVELEGSSPTLAILKRYAVMSGTGKLTGSVFAVTHDPGNSMGSWGKIPEVTLASGEPLYYSQVHDAYPLATGQEQQEVLTRHFEIVEEHPDFARRFPPRQRE